MRAGEKAFLLEGVVYKLSVVVKVVSNIAKGWVKKPKL